jgi:hypothetical protein
MAMKRRMALRCFPVLFALCMASGTEQARSMDVPNLDLRVVQVSFTPARAHVGDTIRITVRATNMGDPGVNKTFTARILANDKEADSQLFTFGWDPGTTNYTVQFQWNTGGAAPGEYRIKADFSFYEDTSPFDNDMTVKQRLILVPAGAPFPDGQPAGGTATETDPGARKWWDQ